MYALRREGAQCVLHIWCNHLNNIAICPKCGAIVITVHEEKKRCIRHLALWEITVLRGFVGKTAYRFFFWLIADLRGKHDELQEYRGGKVLQQVGFQMIYNTFLL